MPEQHENAPMTGESGNTPATDASSTASGQSAPQSTPTSSNTWDDSQFKLGYGKGADKGRREGMELVLKELGLPTDLEAARQRLSSLKPSQTTQAETPPVNVRETNEYRSLAEKHLEAAKQLDALTKRLEVAAKQADEARLEKLRNAALRHGVGDGQVEALVALHSSEVRLNERGELEILSRMPDGELAAAGQPVNDWLDAVTKKNPWLLAPTRTTGGAGSTPGPTRSAPERRESGPFFDTRPLTERLKGR